MFDIYEPVEVLWFGYMEEVVCNGDDLILNLLFNFEPMKGLEHWGDVRMFGSANNSACKSILNMLKHTIHNTQYTTQNSCFIISFETFFGLVMAVFGEMVCLSWIGLETGGS